MKLRKGMSREEFEAKERRSGAGVGREWAEVCVENARLHLLEALAAGDLTVLDYCLHGQPDDFSQPWREAFVQGASDYYRKLQERRAAH